MTKQRRSIEKYDKINISKVSPEDAEIIAAYVRLADIYAGNVKSISTREFRGLDELLHNTDTTAMDGLLGKLIMRRLKTIGMVVKINESSKKYLVRRR